jgi:hypothetical protein
MDACSAHGQPWELADDWDGDETGVWYSPVFRCRDGCEVLARPDGAGGYYPDDTDKE